MTEQKPSREEMIQFLKQSDSSAVPSATSPDVPLGRPSREQMIAELSGAEPVKPKKSRISEMLSEPVSIGVDKSGDIKGLEVPKLSIEDRRGLLGYADKISRGEVSPIDPLARTGQKAGELVMAIPGVSESLESGMNISSKIGESLNFNKYLPESIRQGIESGATTLDQVLEVIMSNPYVNIAIKDAFDASNLAPVLAASKAVSPLVRGTGKVIKKTGEGITRQATGLGDETIKTLTSDNKSLSGAIDGDITRKSLGDIIEEAIESKSKGLGDTGTEYGAIRNLDVKIKNPLGELDDYLKGKGLKSNNKGALMEREALSSNLTPTDISQIQKAKEILSQADELSPNQVLNLRNKLDDLAGFDSGTSTKGKEVIKGMRKIVDDKAKDNIPGLRELDESYAKQISDLNKFKKDFLTREGDLKDTAFNKVANSQGKGKEILADRLEKLSPGIGEKVRALKAAEDIAFAANKPGTYFSSGVALGGAGAVLTGGNPAFIAMAIMSQPQVAANILRHGSKVLRTTSGAIKSGGGKLVSPLDDIILKLESGAKLTPVQVDRYRDAIMGFATGEMALESANDSDDE